MSAPGPFRGRAARGRATRSLVAALLGCAIAAGCASTPGSSTDDVLSTDRRTLSAEELATVPGTSLFDALQRLRPLWLVTSGSRTRSVNVRSSTIVVTDGRYFGGIDSLHGLPVTGIRHVRYVTGSEAASAYPSVTVGGHVEAVILVEYGNERPPSEPE